MQQLVVVVLAAVQLAEVLAAVQPVVQLQLAVHHVKLVVDEQAVVEVLAAVAHPLLFRFRQRVCNMCLASLQWWQQQQVQMCNAPVSSSQHSSIDYTIWQLLQSTLDNKSKSLELELGKS